MHLFFLITLSVAALTGCKPPSRGGAAIVAQVSDAEGLGNALKRFWPVPAFELVDQESRVFNSAQMLGKIWVVDFFYTSCPGPCPALTSRLSEVHRSFSGENRIGFLSISSDPEKDQPAVLKKYAEKFNADSRWLFLTGQTSAIFSLANQGFKLSLTRTEGGVEPVTHSTRLVLVDGSGWVRGFYEGVGEEGNEASVRLGEGIRKLLEEIK
ncbi:MAG: protein SCO1/2 [Verrucomicrobia bacterium]|nr:MAG: protein SCO1/2 [Verrucomicrobiota bacterium]